MEEIQGTGIRLDEFSHSTNLIPLREIGSLHGRERSGHWDYELGTMSRKAVVAATHEKLAEI